MPTDEDMDAGTPEPHVEEPVETKPVAETPKFGLAPPTFGLEQIKAIVSEAVREAVVATQPRPQAIEATIPDLPTDEEIANNPRTSVEKLVARALAPIQRDVNALRDFGLERISALTQSVVGNQLPFYKRFQSEIDAKLGTLPAAVRSDPTTIKLVHDTIVADHTNELLQEARQEGSRQARVDAPVPTGPAGRFVTKDNKGVPTPEELGLDANAIEEIDRSGGPDRFAQTISGGRWKTWAEYAKAADAFRKAPTNRRGSKIIPLDKITTKRNAIVGN